MKGIRCATACFITRADFTTCGRNILPGAEQVADDVHAVHQRAFDHVQRTAAVASISRQRFFGVVGDEVGDAVHQRVRSGAADRHGALRRPRQPAS